MKKRRLWIGILLIVLVVGLGANFFFRSAFASELKALPKRIQVLYDVYQLISNFYVDDVNSDKLIDGAVKGMVGELDPFSTFLDTKAYKAMQTDLFEGSFGGVGIVITIRDEKLTIVSPIKNTPGEKVGLMANDVILEVDGKSTEGISTETAADWMRGEPGTKVKLIVKRGDAEPVVYEITRAMVEVPFMEYELRKDQIGYVNVAKFGQGVGRDVEKAVTEMLSKGAKGIILDLRNNPGGLLSEAVDMGSVFIDQGPIVHVRQRGNMTETLKVNRFVKHVKTPLVVLVNGGSASASEIVSGAVQDTGVGVLMGTKTFGKGTVQQVIPLSDGSAISMTIARYYTPKDRFIHEHGLDPDIVVELDAEQYKKGIDNQLDAAVKYILEGKANQLKPAS